MSAYLLRLKQIDVQNKLISPEGNPPELTKAPYLKLLPSFGGFGSINRGDTKIIDSDVSNWWHLTYEGHHSKNVAIYPPCNEAEAIALNKSALSVEAIPTPISNPISIDEAKHLIHIMRDSGYRLNVDGDDLHVDQVHWIDEELASLIKLHKADLIMILKGENNHD